jgi:hypothetical protein
VKEKILVKQEVAARTQIKSENLKARALLVRKFFWIDHG